MTKLDIFSTVGRVIRLSSKAYQGSSEERLATSVQWTLFSYIKVEPTATVSGIAKQLSIKTPTATQLVERSVNKGFLVRVPSETDRRVIYIKLTSQGEQQYIQIKQQISLRTNQVLKHLSSAEIEQLHKILDKIANGLEKESTQNE